jgi:membrane protein
MPVLEKSKLFARQLFSDFSKDDCPSMAAALAYYTVFALPSLLLILIFIVGLVYGQEAASGQIQAKLGNQMGPQAAAEIETMIRNAGQSRGAGIIATLLGLVGLILSATSVVMQLQMCLNRAWKVQATGSGMRGFVQKRVNSGLLLVGVGVLMMVSLAASSILSAFSRSLPWAPAARVADNLLSLVVFAAMFAVILKMLPDVRLRWGDVWIGGLVIAILFVLGKFLIGLYLGHTGASSTYGVAGSLALILLWIYYSSIVFLFGVEFTQVWVHQRGREVEPKPGATRISREATAQA